MPPITSIKLSVITSQDTSHMDSVHSMEGPASLIGIQNLHQTGEKDGGKERDRDRFVPSHI